MSDLGTIKFFLTPSHPCSYLANKEASTLFADPNLTIDTEAYSSLSEMGFRRSGDHIYRPHCSRCNACIPTRVITQEFILRKRHRRIWKRNQHLTTQVVPAHFSQEHYELYERYIEQRHKDGDMFPPDPEQYKSFLLCNWSDTQFIELRDPESDALISVAVTDRLKNGLSSVYTFFEPSLHQQSLGTFSILKQIELAQTYQLPYLFIGYWIKECQKMSYKNEFRPIELFINHHWERVGA